MEMEELLQHRNKPIDAGKFGNSNRKLVSYGTLWIAYKWVKFIKK